MQRNDCRMDCIVLEFNNRLEKDFNSHIGGGNL